MKSRTNEMEQLVNYFKAAFPHTTGLSVIVDNSRNGHEALIKIVEKSSEVGKAVLVHHILRGEVTGELILALNFLQSNIVFADVDQNSLEMVLNMTEEMGLISFDEKLSMFMAKRSIVGIQGACYKPKYHYYFSDYQQSSSNATYITEKVNGCRRIGDSVERVTCFSRFVSLVFHH